MKSFRVAIFALLLTSLAHARPNVIDEWVRLPPPTDGNWQIIGSFGVAIDGDWALVSAFSPCPTCTEGETDVAALLYHYTSGSWQYQGILGTASAGGPVQAPGPRDERRHRGGLAAGHADLRAHQR